MMTVRLPTTLSGVDGPGGWFRPTTDDAWRGLKIPVPDYYFLGQDGSGALIERNGGPSMAADGAGLRYQQTVAGWKSKFVGLLVDTANNGWRHTTAQGIQPGTNSIAILMYLHVAALPPGNRTIGDWSHTDGYYYMLPTTGQIALRGNNIVAVSTNGYAVRTTPFLFVVNRTLSTIKAYTDLETWSLTWYNVPNGYKGLHTTGSVALNVVTNLIAHWEGANAETLGKATLETLTRTTITAY